MSTSFIVILLIYIGNEPRYDVFSFERHGILTDQIIRQHGLTVSGKNILYSKERTSGKY